MIIDSHCHAWRFWPYVPTVPDPESRGTIEQLLWEMDQNGVDRAALVCARIDHNPDDNDYIAGAVKRFPDRLYQIADVDCEWWPTYQAPGAADRLAEAVAAYHLKGFTHYVKKSDDGSWYLSAEGDAFFAKAAELKQIASLSIPAHLQSVLREVARRHPTVEFLCHHMAGARASEAAPYPILADILRSGDSPNIHVKMSGFHYVSANPWGFPYDDCQRVVRGLYESFGSDRLHWGSDYPVVRKAMTYQLSLEAFRAHCGFIPAADQGLILGDSLFQLLEAAG